MSSRIFFNFLDSISSILLSTSVSIIAFVAVNIPAHILRSKVCPAPAPAPAAGKCV